jgi:hypothetical protein
MDDFPFLWTILGIYLGACTFLLISGLRWRRAEAAEPDREALCGTCAAPLHRQYVLSFQGDVAGVGWVWRHADASVTHDPVPLRPRVRR